MKNLHGRLSSLLLNTATQPALFLPTLIRWPSLALLLGATRMASSASADASSVTRVTATTRAELDASLASAAAAGSAQPTFVLFSGAVVPSTGVSWCSDCVEADPVIEGALAKVAGGCVLIKVPLVREEFKGNAAHWARTGFNVQRIPTLSRWGKTKAVGSLVEDECKDAAKVEDLVVA